MLRQYAPPRHRLADIGGRWLPVGTVPAGTVFYRNRCKLIVDAWLPRRIGAARKVDGRYVDGFAARGGHLAVVRRLDTGRQSLLADHIIRHCVDGAP